MPKRSDNMRFNATEACRILHENGGFHSGTLVNLSDEGFCVEGTSPFELHERIEMRTNGAGRILGIVRWCEGSRAGGVLLPFSRGAFDR